MDGFAPLELAAPDVLVDRTGDGVLILRSRQPLEQYEPHVALWLRRWADEAPDRLFLAERSPDGGWRRVSYSEAYEAARAVGQALLERGLSAERPVLVLSGNSVDHALLMLGAMFSGIPIVPVSPAYSLMSEAFDKLSHIHRLVQPGLVYVADPNPFARALDALDLGDTELVASTAVGAATPFWDLASTQPGPEVDRAFDAITPDTVAKVLFTSGSTGLPKGVLNTHRMLCSNQQAIAQCWPFVSERPPVLIDWLPWNHTFGANHNFNLVLRNGGTLYIDGGKPRPGLVEETVRNLREISPTIYFNVPAGFGALLPYLEQDEALRRSFFAKLDLIFYAGAALSQDLWERLEKLALETLGQRVVMTSAWGSTETAPLATSAHFILERAGNIGVPAPGTAIKMVPNGEKLELRVRGPNVTSGYFRQAELTEQAFDEDGFYKIGDAGKLADPDDPSRGILFDGRVVEDFKLATGTWVHVGALRVAAIAASTPVIQDAVVTGQDRDFVCLLAWPNVAACRQLTGAPEDEPVAALLRRPEVQDRIVSGLQAHNAAHRTSSMRVGRVLLMADPPSIDANEITDKGYVNQRATLERRAERVESLYRDPPGDDVLVIG